jgi:hypothetical protein
MGGGSRGSGGRTPWGDYADSGSGGFGSGWDEFVLLGIPLYGDPQYVTYGTNVPLGSSSWSDGTGASGTLTSISFWYTPIIGSGFDLLSLLQPPDVSASISFAPSKAPRKPTKGQSPATKYAAFLGCYYNSFIETITDLEDGKGPIAYGFINSGAAASVLGAC